VIYRFTHMTGPNQNQVDTVEACPITLGRDDVCSIRFDKWKELSVSGQHAQIDEVDESTWQIANLSKNGLLVNGVPCDSTVKLPNHSTIQLGKDGPRVRFDVDQHISGVSKTDVMKKKEQTKKLSREQVEQRKPVTEERSVFQAQELASRGKNPNTTMIVAVGAAVLAVIGAIAAIVLIH